MGTFTIENNNINNNLDILETKIGSDLVTEIKNGKKVKAQLIIDNYAFYAKNHTSPIWDLKIVDIFSFDIVNNEEN